MTRRVDLGDAVALASLLQDNREFLAPYEPERSDGYWTVDGQRAAIAEALDRYAGGDHVPHVILDERGQVAGRVTLNHIVRGPFLSGVLGYWLAEAANGRGLATAAAREMVRLAFDDLGLHRVQAGTLMDNARSQRVLERCGFVRFGLAPRYLKIAGAWRDHVLYQVLNPALE